MYSFVKKSFLAKNIWEKGYSKMEIEMHISQLANGDKDQKNQSYFFKNVV